jgi:biotin transport system substrate-specific component
MSAMRVNVGHSVESLSLDERTGYAGVCASIIFVAAAIALGAFIRIPLPFTPVPLTLQTLPVLMCGCFLGPRRATAGTLLYVFAGLAGLPVFATPFGPTAGYLAGFILAPWLIARFNRVPLGMCAATMLIYLLGAMWLCIAYGMSPAVAVMTGVTPFVAGDALKLVVAWQAVRRFSRDAVPQD